MISKSAYRSASIALKTMSRDDTRKILRALNMYGGMTVTALWIHTRVPDHSIVCTTLKRLRDCNVVSTRRNKKEIIYSINDEGMKAIKSAARLLNQ